MKRYWSATRGGSLARVLVLIALVAGYCGIAIGDEIEGTWQLVLRVLPDGTAQRPPTVMGRGTAGHGMRHLNVFWRTPEGNPASYSLIAEYGLSEREYTETVLFSVFDEGNGNPPAYNLSGETRSMPVTRQGTRISYQLPFDPPSVVYDGDKLTATLGGAFVDYWERVR